MKFRIAWKIVTHLGRRKFIKRWVSNNRSLTSHWVYIELSEREEGTLEGWVNLGLPSLFESFQHN